MANPVHVGLGIGAVVAAAGVSLAASLGLFSEDDSVENQVPEEVVIAEPLSEAESGVASSDAEDEGEQAEALEKDPPVIAELSREEKLKQFAFDVVRVEPSGDAVFAGRGPANMDIVLSYSLGEDSEGNTHDLATTTSSEQGDWAAVSDRPLPAGASVVWLGFADEEGNHYADLRLLIEVPSDLNGEVLIVEMLNDQTRTVIAGVSEDVSAEAVVDDVATTPTQENAEAGVADNSSSDEAPKLEEAEPPVREVAINFIENDVFKLRLGGRAASEAFLRLYVDDQPQADFVADISGRFHQTIDLLDGDRVMVRLDHIGKNGDVLSRAETDYTVIRPRVPEKRPQVSELVKAEVKPTVTITSIDGNVSSGALVADLQEKTVVDTIDPDKLDGETFGYTDKGDRVITKDGKRYVEAFELTFEEADPQSSDLGNVDKDTEEVVSETVDEPLEEDKSAESDVQAKAEREPEVDTVEADNKAQDQLSVIQTQEQAVSNDVTDQSMMKDDALEEAKITPSTLDDSGDDVAKPKHVEVKRGDSLWRIASKFYGEGLRYTVIFKENKQQIRDPDLIYPGQVFMMPKLNRVLTPVE